MNSYYVAGVPYSDELYHHGILGQKWGVRRFQNRDGSLTAEGRARYGSNGSRTESVKKALSTAGNAIAQGGKSAAIGVGRFSKRIGQGVGRATKATADYAMQRFKMNHPSFMTDQELKDYTNRMIQESNYLNTLRRQQRDSGIGHAKEFVGGLLENGAKTLAEAGFRKIASEMTKSPFQRENDKLKYMVENKDLRKKLLEKKEEGGLEKARRIMNDPNASESDIAKASKILKDYGAARGAAEKWGIVNKDNTGSNPGSSSVVERARELVSDTAQSNTNNGYRMRSLESMEDQTRPGSKTRSIVYNPPVTRSGYAPSVSNSNSDSTARAIRSWVDELDMKNRRSGILREDRESWKNKNRRENIGRGVLREDLRSRRGY